MRNIEVPKTTGTKGPEKLTENLMSKEFADLQKLKTEVVEGKEAKEAKELLTQIENKKTDKKNIAPQNIVASKQNSLPGLKGSTEASIKGRKDANDALVSDMLTGPWKKVFKFFGINESDKSSNIA